MIDINDLRKNPELIKEKLKKRNFSFELEKFNSFEKKRKSLQIKTQELQEKRNKYSKEIGLSKKLGRDTSEIMVYVSELSDDLKNKQEELELIKVNLEKFLLEIPNITHNTVPLGNLEADNIEIKKVGKKKAFDFDVKDHVELGFGHGLEFDLASKVTGSRFVFLRNKMAKLHRALVQFMLDIHTKNHGYEELYAPYIVNETSLIGTGQLPKFEQDLFAIKSEKDERLFLIPTAEVPVTNIFGNSIIDGNDLPTKFVCHSPCFRSEAGSYGRDTKGMIRQHQFDKVELVQAVTPTESYETLEELTAHAEKVLIELNLPFRRVLLCGGDIGFSSAKTYDLEVWLPGQNKYREISSCSNFESFQARRMKARFRDKNGKINYIHTLNGSALAVGRTLVALIENYQKENGDIQIPEVLVPYMNEDVLKFQSN